MEVKLLSGKLKFEIFHFGYKKSTHYGFELTFKKSIYGVDVLSRLSLLHRTFIFFTNQCEYLPMSSRELSLSCYLRYFQTFFIPDMNKECIKLAKQSLCKIRNLPWICYLIFESNWGAPSDLIYHAFHFQGTNSSKFI